MPIVAMPDGAQVEFPDNMPAEQIRGLIASKFPEAAGVPSSNRTILDQGLQGVTFGLGDEIAGALGGYGAKAYDALTGSKLFPNESPIDVAYQGQQLANQDVKSEMANNPKTSIAANLAGGLLTGGALGETNIGAALANNLKTGGLTTRVAKNALVGAASGGLYGAGSGDTGQRLEGAESGALTGGALSGAFPAIGAAASGIKNSVLPAISDVVRPLAQQAIDYGIPLSRSQIGEDKTAKLIASATAKVPFSGAQNFQRTQQDAFNKAIAKTIGETAINNRVTPEVIDNAFTNIGDKFDSVLAGRQVKISDDVLNKLADLESSTQNITDAHAKIVKNNIDQFLNDLNPDGTISGEKIGSFRSALTKTLKETHNDASPYLHNLQDIVVDASVDGAPVAKKILNEARLQYKNLKTIQPLANKAINGDISPSLLLGRVSQNFGNNFSRGGGGDLGNLARIGQTFLKDPIPDSGTAQRAMIYKAMETLGAGGAGYAAAGGTGVLPALVTPVAISRGLNSLNTNQALVKRALQLQQTKAPFAALLPDILAGQAGLNQENK